MMSHHVTCHVTSLSRAFFIVLKKNKNKNKNKNKIKRKIDKRKNKMIGPKCSITILTVYSFSENSFKANQGSYFLFVL